MPKESFPLASLEYRFTRNVTICEIGRSVLGGLCYGRRDYLHMGFLKLFQLVLIGPKPDRNAPQVEINL